MGCPGKVLLLVGRSTLHAPGDGRLLPIAPIRILAAGDHGLEILRRQAEVGVGVRCPGANSGASRQQTAPTPDSSLALCPELWLLPPSRTCPGKPRGLTGQSSTGLKSSEPPAKYVFAFPSPHLLVFPPTLLPGQTWLPKPSPSSSSSSSSLCATVNQTTV